jgi:hypothetical protein
MHASISNHPLSRVVALAQRDDGYEGAGDSGHDADSSENGKGKGRGHGSGGGKGSKPEDDKDEK